MRRLRRAGKPAVAGGLSLFPFLAVLICVMGSLIVLLVVLARNARLQATEAAARAAAERDADIGQIGLRRETLQWRAEQVLAARDAAEERLADARLRLGGAEDHIRSLKKDLERLRIAFEEMERTASGQSTQRDQLEKSLALSKARLDAAEKRLADEREKARTRRRSYAIVPYEGPHGTHRRPIYIECRRNVVVLQPEGIHLGRRDFHGPLGSGNPLASALRAAREHLARRAGGFADEDDEPYPLLLVRPDGIDAYYAAREAMESWGADFGYELIGEDWNLEFPPADPNLSHVMAQAVDSARKRQEMLAEIAPRYARSRSKPVFRAGPRGIVRERGPEVADDVPPGPRIFAFGGGGEGREGLPGHAGRAMPGTALAEDGPSGSGSQGGRGGWQDTPGRGGAESPAASRDAGAGAVSGNLQGGFASHMVGPRDSDPIDAARARQETQADRTGPYGRRVDGRPEARPAGPARSAAGDPRTRAGTPLRPGEWYEPPPQSASRSGEGQASDHDVRARRSGGSLAELRGRDWGLPETGHGAVPITRPIRVDCHADRLVIDPQGAASSAVVPLRPRTRDSIDDFVSKIWDHMDGWGIAGRGMYWRPVLSVRVAPGGESRYQDLSQLLEGSGLQVELKAGR